jgi:large-conductance mechanosensitive channel
MFEILKLEKFQSEFKSFIVENRLVGTAAGVTIGISTKDLIQSAVGDIIIPFIYLIISFLGIKKVELLAGKTEFDTISFIRQFITWILSIITVFFFVYYFFMSVAGIDKTTSETTTTTTSKSQPQQQTTPKSQPPQTKRKRNIKNGSIDYDSTTDPDNTESFYQRYSAF